MNKLKLMCVVCALFVGGMVNASVIYTDYTPDISDLAVVGAASYYDFDLDGDGTDDYYIRVDNFGGWFVHLGSNNSANELHMDITQTAIILNLGDNISSALSWGSCNSSPEPWLADVTVPNLMDIGYQYIGVHFSIGANMHYGWVRIMIEGDGYDPALGWSWTGDITWTIEDFAYESTPDTPILAGDMGTPAILVTSIAVQGQGGATSITTPGGQLQMEAVVLPVNATNMNVTWSVQNVTGMGTIDANGILTASANGTVSVIATALDGSGVSGDAVITITNQDLGISKDENDLALKIFPNPTMNYVEIKMDMNESAELKIYSIDGRVITWDNYILEGQKVEVSNLESGEYILVVIQEGKLYSSRFVKQ